MPPSKPLSRFKEYEPLGASRHLFRVKLPCGNFGIFSTLNGGKMATDRVCNIITRANGTDFYLRSEDLAGIFCSLLSRLVVPMEFNSIDHLSGRYYKVGQKGLFGAYSATTQTYVAPMLFDRLQKIGSNTDHCQVWNKKNRCGVFSVLLNDYVVPMNFTGVVEDSNTLYTVWDEARRGTFDTVSKTTNWR